MADGSEVGTRASPRVAVLHQGYVPVYRVSFFEALAARGKATYEIFHGTPPSGGGRKAADGPFAFHSTWVRNREIRFLGRTLVYQHVLKRVIGGRFDALVLGHELKFAANLILFAIHRLRGRPVLLWGQGFQKRELGRGPRWVHGAVARAKTWLARRATGYLAYTPGGAHRLAAGGVDERIVTVVNNTMDVEGEIARHDRLRTQDPGALRTALGLAPDSVVLLYLGRLYKEKAVGDLLTTVRRFAQTRPASVSVEVVIIGDGPERAVLEREAGDLDGVQFAGEVYDPDRIGQYLRVAAAVVLPGSVGLAVCHAFSHGVPVLARDSTFHGPEVEYIVSDRNGMVVPGTIEDFCDAVAAFVSDPELQIRLAQGALASRERLTLASMVTAFDGAVMAAIERNAAARHAPPAGR